jgi:hypothetical protein
MDDRISIIRLWLLFDWLLYGLAQLDAVPAVMIRRDQSEVPQEEREIQDDGSKR